MAALVLSGTCSESVFIQCLDMAYYIWEEVYMNLSQILDLQFTLRDITDKHGRDPPEKSMRGQGFHSSH